MREPMSDQGRISTLATTLQGRLLLRALACLFAMALSLPAQERAIAVMPNGERRVALVIGNGGYGEAPLKNPPTDARAMAKALESCGFKVSLVVNANRVEMFKAVRDFGERIQGGGVGLFYYAGHGMQVKGSNYLIPVGVDINNEDEVPVQALDVNAVLSKMDSAKNRLNLLILDACRNNPFARSFRSANRGLSQMEAPSGSFLAFATAPGSTASDGEGGQNGLYTQHLLKAMQQRGLKVEEVFKQVRIEVKKASRDQQVPWDSSSLTGEFYFRTEDDPVPAGLGSAPVKAPVVTPAYHQNQLGMTFSEIPTGTFTMGGSGSNEQPRHTVSVTSFWLGRTVVTQAQWKAVMGNAPSKFKGDELPVEQVSWEDAQRFIAALNAKQSDRSYRLPTEAEWEYACRAGTTGETYGDLDAIAWFSSNSGKTTHPVGQKQANNFGLYDMLGNVWQWCEDNGHDNYQGAPTDGSVWQGRDSRRVFRGGSWFRASRDLRSASRLVVGQTFRGFDVGFRLVCVPKRTDGGPPDYRRNQKGMTFSKIPVGTFTMGGSGRGGPRHTVSVPGFWLGTTTVTQAQWKAAMGDAPSNIKGDDLPVEMVSWEDAKRFVAALNLKETDRSYRLPSEAEWEYACRAGSTGETYGDLDAIAWHVGNSGKTTHPVGQKQANAFGLYDMLGNVWQWCEDNWHDDYQGAPNVGSVWQGGDTSRRVMRGGSWRNRAQDIHPAGRYKGVPNYRHNDLGFRVVCVPKVPE